MINLFVRIIKIEKQNMSAQTIINQLCSSFLTSSDNRCCACSRTGMMYLRDYTRWLTEYRYGRIIETELKTNRYRCDCGRTHVLLPSLIIPYGHHSLSLIIHALYDYYSHSLTVDGVCARYHISVPTLYRWKTLYEKDKELWLNGLRNIETSPLSFLNKLLNDQDMIGFLNEFRQSVFPHRMFLQSHPNAFSHQFV